MDKSSEEFIDFETEFLSESRTEQDELLTHDFSFRQVGSITTVVEPVGAETSIESLAELFETNPNLKGVPIDRNGAVIGLLEKSVVENINSSAWQKFWQKDLDNYIIKTSVMLQANDFIEKNLQHVLEENRKTGATIFPVFLHRNFLGIVWIHDFLDRITEITKQDMEKARTVQQHLLNNSKNQNLPFTFTTWNRMANTVGGDFFKCFCVEENKKYIIGCFDVSGKNVAAALSTMTIGTFFSALKHFTTPVPFGPKITALLDEYVQEVTPPGIFTTGVLCYIDYEKNTITIQNCGHTSVFIFIPQAESKKISVKTLNANLPPFGMGAVNESEQTAMTIPIQKGIRINMYSDGFTDMQTPDGVRFEDENTKRFFFSTYGKKQDEFLEQVSKTVENWILDAMLIDDITILDINF